MTNKIVLCYYGYFVMMRTLWTSVNHEIQLYYCLSMYNHYQHRLLLLLKMISLIYCFSKDLKCAFIGWVEELICAYLNSCGELPFMNCIGLHIDFVDYEKLLNIWYFNPCYIQVPWSFIACWNSNSWIIFHNDINARNAGRCSDT